MELLNARLKSSKNYFQDVFNNRNMPILFHLFNFTKPAVLKLGENSLLLYTLSKETLNPIAYYLQMLYFMTQSDTISQSTYDSRKEQLYKLNPFFRSLPEFAEFGTPERDSIIQLYTELSTISIDYNAFCLETKNELKRQYIADHLARIELLPPLQTFVSRGNMMFLFINVHGGLRYTADKITSIAIPENLEIYRVMQSTFGAVNICTRDKAESLFNKILSNAHMWLTDKKKKNTLKNNRKIAKHIIKTSLPRAKCILNEVRTITPANTQHRVDFISKCVQPHTKHFTTGQPMIDKMLSIEFDGFGLAEINIVTDKLFKEAINLVDYMPIDIDPTMNTIQFKLSDVIAMVSPFINILVLFDLSCSAGELPFNLTARNATVAEPNPSFNINSMNSPLNIYIDKSDIIKRYGQEYVRFKDELFNKNVPPSVLKLGAEFMAGLKKLIEPLPDLMDEMPDFSDYLEEYKQKLVNHL